VSDKPKKERIDKLLVDQGLVSTRARAQAMIIAGHILVNDVPITKPGEKILETSSIRLREAELKYVSRGALKLKAAMDTFRLLADLARFCWNTGHEKYSRLMWARINSLGKFAMIHESFRAKTATRVILNRRILMKCRLSL
jgi:ribosomal protein S4